MLLYDLFLLASINLCNTYTIVMTKSFRLLQSWWSLMKSYIINDSLLYLKEGKILKLQLLTLSVNIFQNIWYAAIFTPKGTNKRQKVNIEMLILARHLIWIATDELPLLSYNQPLYVSPTKIKWVFIHKSKIVIRLNMHFRYV